MELSTSNSNKLHNNALGGHTDNTRIRTHPNFNELIDKKRNYLGRAAKLVWLVLILAMCAD
jgi:hypothetical protein